MATTTEKDRNTAQSAAIEAAIRDAIPKVLEKGGLLVGFYRFARIGIAFPKISNIVGGQT